jgi:hypothetical protein
MALARMKSFTGMTPILRSICVITWIAWVTSPFVLDIDGNGLERYSYDAFGTSTVTDWNGTNPRSYSWYGNRFMFTGREYFPELGLYDYRFRFHHPASAASSRPTRPASTPAT